MYMYMYMYRQNRNSQTNNLMLVYSVHLAQLYLITQNCLALQFVCTLYIGTCYNNLYTLMYMYMYMNTQKDKATHSNTDPETAL